MLRRLEVLIDLVEGLVVDERCPLQLDDDAAGIGRGGYNVGVLPLREDALRLKASCAIS